MNKHARRAIVNTLMLTALASQSGLINCENGVGCDIGPEPHVYTKEEGAELAR